MSRIKLLSRVLPTIAAAALPALSPAVADAGTSASGGTSAPSRPVIAELSCAQGQPRCARGETLTVQGEGLRDAKIVTFLGRRGRQDDRRARPRLREDHRLTVRVPSRARTGAVRITSTAARAARSSTRVLIRSGAPSTQAPEGAPGLLDAIFPIRGKHDLGQTATNNFGGDRGHQGQDMFAACGTRLVAARGGTVAFTDYQSRAGNYVVISGPDKSSYVYMHMRKPSPLRKGQRVLTGQTVGEVGDTGRARGCHLHFERWTAPGWYQGGKAFDPLPELTRWDAVS